MSGTSKQVTISTTPSTFQASERSNSLTQPLAMVLCSTLATNAWGGIRSGVYFALPVTLSNASTRFREVPMISMEFLLQNTNKRGLFLPGSVGNASRFGHQKGPEGASFLWVYTHHTTNCNKFKKISDTQEKKMSYRKCLFITLQVYLQKPITFKHDTYSIAKNIFLLFSQQKQSGTITISCSI